MLLRQSLSSDKLELFLDSQAALFNLRLWLGLSLILHRLIDLSHVLKCLFNQGYVGCFVDWLDIVSNGHHILLSLLFLHHKVLLGQFVEGSNDALAEQVDIVVLLVLVKCHLEP